MLYFIRPYGIPESGPIPDRLAKKLIHGYYASVSYTDAQIGRVLDSLEFFDMNGELQAKMLYDLRIDPQENDNVAGEPGRKRGYCYDQFPI